MQLNFENMKCPIFQPITTAATTSPTSISIPLSSVSTEEVKKLLGPTSSAHIDNDDTGLESSISTDLKWRSQITDVHSFAAYMCSVS
jgi:hypothetical protein